MHACVYVCMCVCIPKILRPKFEDKIMGKKQVRIVEYYLVNILLKM